MWICSTHVSSMWWYVSNPDTHISCPLQNSVLTRCPRPPVTAHSFLNAWPQTARKQLVSKCFHMHTGIPAYANRSGILMRLVASFPQSFTTSGDAICLKFGGVWEMLWIFKVGRWTHNRCMKINKSPTVSNGVGASSFEIWTPNLAQLLTLGTTQTNLWSFIFGDSNWKFCKVGYLLGTLKPDTQKQTFLIWDLFCCIYKNSTSWARHEGRGAAAWNCCTFQPVVPLDSQPAAWNCCTFQPVVPLDSQPAAWNCCTFQPVVPLDSQPAAWNCCTFQPVVPLDSQPAAWNCCTFQPVVPLDSQPAAWNCCTFQPVVPLDSQPAAWNCCTFQPVVPLDSQPAAWNCCTFQPVVPPGSQPAACCRWPSPQTGTSQGWYTGCSGRSQSASSSEVLTRLSEKKSS